ncbi:MAG: ribosome recycling factor [Candidatus Symbiobacter sp.]|nr:ribosome recycling factor [Candidatus Symbiobacter sp.]
MSATYGYAVKRLGMIEFRGKFSVDGVRGLFNLQWLRFGNKGIEKMTQNFDASDMQRRMASAIDALHKEFIGLRTGRASVNLLDKVMVDAYGQSMPLNQVSTIAVTDARSLSVQVWDKAMLKPVEKGIHDAGLGLNPQSEGLVVRLRLPELNEERRTELSKIASKYAEQAKVAVRNVRRDGLELLKKLEKDSQLSQDEHRRHAEEVQLATDKAIKKIDESLAHKAKEIMQI